MIIAMPTDPTSESSGLPCLSTYCVHTMVNIDDLNSAGTALTYLALRKCEHNNLTIQNNPLRNK